jgi:hypothetical protein
MILMSSCGNLSPAMISSFFRHSELEQVVGLVNLGCCYQLLTEKEQSDSEGTFGFPMSEFLSGKILGLNSLMVACQAPKRWANHIDDLQDSLKRLYYRSCLEKLIVDQGFPRPNPSSKSVKKLGVQECIDPITYTRAAFSRLGYQHYIPDGTILGTFDWHSSAQSEIAVLWTLRTLMAESIESILLLDRLLYTLEEGCHSTLIPICDPIQSPRNMALVSLRK